MYTATHLRPSLGCLVTLSGCLVTLLGSLFASHHLSPSSKHIKYTDVLLLFSHSQKSVRAGIFECFTESRNKHSVSGGGMNEYEISRQHKVTLCSNLEISWAKIPIKIGTGTGEGVGVSVLTVLPWPQAAEGNGGPSATKTCFSPCFFSLAFAAC